MRVLVFSRGRMFVPHAQSILPVNPQPVAAGRERVYTRPLIKSRARPTPSMRTPRPYMRKSKMHKTTRAFLFRDNSKLEKIHLSSQPPLYPSSGANTYTRDKPFYRSRKWRCGRRGGGVAPCSNPNEQAKLFQSSQAQKLSAPLGLDPSSPKQRVVKVVQAGPIFNLGRRRKYGTGPLLTLFWRWAGKTTLLIFGSQHCASRGALVCFEIPVFNWLV